MTKTPLARRAAVVLGFVSALSALGCKAKSEPPGPEPQKASIATPSPLAVAQPARPILTLADRLGVERERKTEGTPRAEDVYAAIEKAGIVLTDKKQHVGKVFGALYCLGAKGADLGDMGFSVCEYDSAESAKAGLEVSTKAFSSVPHRELLLNRKTLLTIRQPAVKNAQTEAASRAAREAFAKL